jgi:hypothetical protein
VHLVDRIPRTGSGEIQRFKLLERLQPVTEAAGRSRLVVSGSPGIEALSAPNDCEGG